jgi:predicted phage baseplate assembly protein
VPLPSVDLDTRTWADLVDEARSLVPRLAPGWTDHNAHDPGVTLLELLAYVVEQNIYRVNRIPERHRRKFLRLAGFPPAPPRSARGVVAFALRPGATVPTPLPAGVAVGPPGASYRTLAPLVVTDVRLEAVQSYDGRAFVNLTRAWRGGLSIAALGADPVVADSPCLLLGFDRALPVGDALSLWLRVADPVTAATGPHHSLRTVWELHDGADWRALDPAAGEIVDGTRSLSLDGPVVVRAPVAGAPAQVGAVDEPCYWLRCRATAGAPDTVPVLLALAVNAVPVEQRAAARQTFRLAPGPALPAAVVPGAHGPLALTLDGDGAIVSLAFGAGVDGPEAMVLEHVARTPTAPGALTVTLVLAGRGSGEPAQCLELPDAAVAEGEVELWTGTRWEQRDDLDDSGRTDAAFQLEPAASLVCFGDGERGRVAPAGAPVLASYDVTGATPAPAAWSVAGADDAWNAAVTGGLASALDSALTVTVVVPPAGGAPAETVTHAQGRAAAAVWAHERLLELCPPGAPQTLDQVPRALVLARDAPERASTLLDFERLALDVPGVRVLRARAWAALDPRDPCLRAPGTVSVVVLAGMPRSHPQPDGALLHAVWRHLEARRVIGTRLCVVGPTYVDVHVRATVAARDGADADGLAAAVEAALVGFLDPLAGGPRRLGWPFGRDVYRSEVLELIAGVDGVEHVVSLELGGDEDADGCDNVCVAPTALVRSGAHRIEVSQA